MISAVRITTAPRANTLASRQRLVRGCSSLDHKRNGGKSRSRRRPTRTSDDLEKQLRQALKQATDPNIKSTGEAILAAIKDRYPKESQRVYICRGG